MMNAMLTNLNIEKSMLSFDMPSCLYKAPALIAFLLSMEKPKKKKATSSRKKDVIVSNLAFRFVILPNKEQEQLLKQNVGCCRFLWNAMLALYKDRHEMHTAAWYKTDDVPWLKDADSSALANVQLHFERAVHDYQKGDKGHPKFKKKHLAKASFTTSMTTDNIKLTEDSIKLPKIKEPITLIRHRKVPEGGTLKSCTVTQEPNGTWYASLLFEYAFKEECFSPNIEEFLAIGDPLSLRHIGLDMSLPHLYIDSNGERPSYFNQRVIEFTKAYRSLEKRIAAEQRRLSRMQKDSSNYKKQCIKIAKLHAKAKHRRNDFLQQITYRLSKYYDVISIEDLNISALKRTLRFGKSVSDNGWGAFTEMLERKCKREGSVLIRVDKWFPSSRKCVHCGNIHKELSLSDRTYICPKCGHVMDRDHNAAMNIDSEGLRLFIEACTPLE